MLRRFFLRLSGGAGKFSDSWHAKPATEAIFRFRIGEPGYWPGENSAAAPTKTPKDQITKKQTWPKTLQEQIRAVRDQLETAPMAPSTLASHYKRKPEKSVTQVLEALTELGMVRQAESGQYRIREG